MPRDDDTDVPLVGPTPDRAQVYVGPKTIPPATDHQTIETETIRLAPEVDPRAMPTEPSLRPVGRQPITWRRAPVWIWLLIGGGLAIVGLSAVALHLAATPPPKPRAPVAPHPPAPALARPSTPAAAPVVSTPPTASTHARPTVKRPAPSPARSAAPSRPRPLF